MSELPDSWVLAPLGSLLSAITGGGTPSKANAESFRGSIPFMTVKDMHARFIDDTQDHITEAALAESASTLVPADTLIVASRMSLGKIARPRVPVAINQDLKALFLHEGVNKTYIEYAWRASEARIREMGTGTTVKGIRLEDIRGLQVPLAPTNEQTRIADHLDTLLARIKACNDHLDTIPGLLQRFRKAVLASATSGALTEDWRARNPGGDAKQELADYWMTMRASEKKLPAAPDMKHWNTALPDGWAVASVHQFAECLDRLRVPIKKENRKAASGLYPYFGANGEVGRIDEFIFDDELVLVTEDETFYGRTKPIAYRWSGKCWVNNHAHVLRAPTKTANDYLCFALMHYDVEPWLTGTTGRAKLTQQALNSLPIAVPPSAEIEEIVRRVQALFELADGIEARHAAAIAQAQRLTPLTLAKAFRGELVPQEANDEPASALLQRLAQAQAVAAKPKAPRGQPGRKKPGATDAPTAQPDWSALPDGAWASDVPADEFAAVAALTAVLKAWGQPMPQDQARLAAVLCLQPRLFTTALLASQATQWCRLVGAAAQPLPTQVARLQVAVATPWGNALRKMRARGDLLESGQGPHGRWTLTPSALGVDTTGWPDGRAAWVVGHLRAHGMAALLPALTPEASEFIHARAA